MVPGYWGTDCRDYDTQSGFPLHWGFNVRFLKILWANARSESLLSKVKLLKKWWVIPKYEGYDNSEFWGDLLGPKFLHPLSPVLYHQYHLHRVLLWTRSTPSFPNRHSWSHFQLYQWAFQNGLFLSKTTYVWQLIEPKDARLAYVCAYPLYDYGHLAFFQSASLPKCCPWDQGQLSLSSHPASVHRSGRRHHSSDSFRHPDRNWSHRPGHKSLRYVL